MSREIKFRTFFNGMMSKPFKFGEAVRFPDGSASVGRNFELMQFTGLRDANGVEIYEGDLIKAVSRESPHDTLAIYEVVYDSVIAMFVGHFTKPLMLAQAPFNHSICELRFSALVIGNIYEHPELLK